MQGARHHRSDSGPERTALRFGPFRLFVAERLLFDGDRPIRLNRRATDILLALVEQPGRIFSHHELMSHVWPDTFVEDANLRAHISALRRALGHSDFGQSYLMTTPGCGYSFVGPLNNETSPVLLTVPPPAHPGAWPIPLGRVHGRADVIARIQAQLPQQRLISVVGPGGIGKTTVVSTLADAVVGSYPDGIQWIDLAALDRDEMVPPAVAFALGLDNFAVDPTSGIVATLRDRHMLLILDCCERIVQGAALIADSVLRGAPNVHIVATSRERLRTAGEYVVRLPPLGAPTPTGELTLAQAMEYPAVRLFVERAMAALDSFVLTEANLPTIVRICSQLEGVALAIELAAGSLASFGLAQLATLIESRLRLTSSGRRTAEPRHQTMQATLDWSYDTLPEPERLVLQRLAVFAGGADLAAVRAVAADATNDQIAVVANLARLVDKSLVVAEINDASVRYRLLDTTRSYALDKLTASRTLPVVARSHAEWFLRRLEALSAGESASLDEYTADLANIRAALDWAASPDGDAAFAVTLTLACVALWMELSLLGECRSRVGNALALLDPAGARNSTTELMLTAALGTSLMYTSGPVEAAEALWTRVFELAEEFGDTQYQLRALYGLWLYKILVCEYRAALALARRFHCVAENSNGLPDIGVAHRMTSMALHYLGEQAGTREHAQNSLQSPMSELRWAQTARYGVDQQVGSRVLLARSLWLLGYPGQAMLIAQVSVDEAAGVGHANSTCLALADGACLIAIWIGDATASDRFASMLADYAERHTLGVWRTYSSAMRGRVLAQNGVAKEGIILLRAALHELRDTPHDIRFQLYLVWLAEALWIAEEFDEALEAIDQTLERAQRTEERWYLPELLRIRGELLIRRGGSDAIAAARQHFAESLHCAREQKARSWELRTVISVARLPSSGHNAYASLRSVLDGFSEGFETADLRAARRLLSELNKKYQQAQA
jgi:predicted ATPase/DNA-binding winged helix-turn-helix (wHTH) protein